MQVMPQTAEFLAHRSGATTFTIADLGTPQVNIAYGSYYLRYLLDEYHGNVTSARGLQRRRVECRPLGRRSTCARALVGR